MLSLNTLSPIHKRPKRKRIGRGESSGQGKTSGRGHKGQKARSGGYHKVGFEGGQMPLQRRLPKRGFTNIFRKEVGIVNLKQLENLEVGTEVHLELAKEKGWVSSKSKYLKILGVGELSKKLIIKADKASESAAAKIKKAGGSLILAQKKEKRHG